MRQIKASEVKPGMTIRWNQGDMRIELPVKSVKRVGGAVVFQSPREGLAGVPHDVLVTVLPEPVPDVPDRIDEWGTWDNVPEGVVVTTPGLLCHYRKNQGVVEFSDPYDDPDWTEPGVRAMPSMYGPWTRADG